METEEHAAKPEGVEIEKQCQRRRNRRNNDVSTYVHNLDEVVRTLVTTLRLPGHDFTTTRSRPHARSAGAAQAAGAARQEVDRACGLPRAARASKCTHQKIEKN